MRDRMTPLETVFSTLILISVSVITHTFGQVNAMVQPVAGYVTGTVTSAGRPVSSVWVIIIIKGGDEKGRSLTGDDGKYYIGNLDDGAYYLIASRGNRQVRHEVTLPLDRVHDIPDF